MPFMRGSMPLRRTLQYLRQGKIIFREEVKIFTLSYHHKPNPAQKGVRDFVFWNWAQLIFKNPQIQFIKFDKMGVHPFALAFLRNGQEVPFDLEWKSHDEIADMLQSTLGKTALVRKRDYLENMFNNNPADFGPNCQRQCICEVQGQHPCTSLMYAPKYARDTWRWDHSFYNKECPRIHPKDKHLAKMGEQEEDVDKDPPELEEKNVDRGALT